MKTLFLKIIRSYGRDNVRLHSSSASFYITVSALPLLAVLVFIISLISPALVTELKNALYGLLPPDISKGASLIISSLQRKQALSLVPFTVIAAVWSSTKGVGGLCHGIETVFGTDDQRSLLGRFLKGTWRTLLFCLLALFSLVTLASFKELDSQGCIVRIPLFLRVLLFFLSLSVFFSLFFARLSHLPIKSQLIGGSLSSVGFTAFSFFYSLYIRFSLENGSLYAELGTAIFFMLWTYFCVNIIFIGAEVNKILSNK